MRLMAIFIASAISIAIFWTCVVFGGLLFKKYLQYFIEEPFLSTLLVLSLAMLIYFIPKGIKLISTCRGKLRRT